MYIWPRFFLLLCVLFVSSSSRALITRMLVSKNSAFTFVRTRARAHGYTLMEYLCDSHKESLERLRCMLPLGIPEIISAFPLAFSDCAVASRSTMRCMHRDACVMMRSSASGAWPDLAGSRWTKDRAPVTRTMVSFVPFGLNALSRSVIALSHMR